MTLSTGSRLGLFEILAPIGAGGMGEVPARVTRVEIETRKREAWKSLIPADPAGVERISNVLVTPDAKSYACCFTRLLSDLFVVDGLK
jgi:hypothetical protein